uniref:Sperm-tail PG-rich repeat-containing protein 2 n=1 Tax=Trichobilharzia regenti TaxID=157069 RepID=A0AA85JEK5_TRIRE|nr:unnamed protein product [Trichobilharzia regenti]
MYDRQKRIFTFQEKSGTDENVGPGSYSPHEFRCLGYDTGYAPFESLAERKLDFTRADAGLFPSPADYFPSLPTAKIKGCSSIANKAKRFPRFISEGPAPDAYNVVSVWGGKKPDPCGLLLPEKVINQLLGEPNYNKRSISCDKIPYVRFRDVPSIPSGQFVHGYEEGPDGRLQPQPGPKRDGTIGPAFYAPTKEPVFTRYKGCGWSKSTSERNLVRITPNSIGPGQYNPYGDHWEKIIETARERSIVEAERPLAVPRFMDKVVQQLHKDNFPSPCAYNIQDKQFSKSDGSQTPFNTEEKRFKDKVIETPAPNRYDLQDGAISRRWLKRFQPKPFDATAERFTSKSDPGPAPNSYVIKESLTHPHTDVHVSKRIAFGSTAKRLGDKLTSSTKTTAPDNSIPGPAQYSPKRYDEKCSLKGSGMPKAKRETSVILSSAPPPGTYDFGRSFDITQCKRAPAIPRKAEAKQRRECFSHTAERFGKFSVIGPRDPDIPGPAEYCIMESESQKGKFVFQSERFKEVVKEQLPGPADYELSPAVADSVLKGTFNVTLDSPLSFNKWSDEPILVKI